MNATEIAWTDKTANWQAGCSEAGPECDHCYARIMSRRLAFMGQPRYADAVKIDGAWTRRLTWDPDAMDVAFASFRRVRKPTRIFPGSMTDLFHEHAEPGALSALALHVDRLDASGAPATLQILTKRPRVALDWQREHFPLGLPRCVWIGTTAGYQKGWDARVGVLKKIRAHVRFVSAEPLLEQIDPGDMRGIEWLIIGGESGPRARPTDPAWIRALIPPASDAGGAVFVKQLGAVWASTHGSASKAGTIPAEWPADLRIQEFPDV